MSVSESWGFNPSGCVCVESFSIMACLLLLVRGLAVLYKFRDLLRPCVFCSSLFSVRVCVLSPYSIRPLPEHNRNHLVTSRNIESCSPHIQNRSGGCHNRYFRFRRNRPSSYRLSPIWALVVPPNPTRTRGFHRVSFWLISTYIVRQSSSFLFNLLMNSIISSSTFIKQITINI